MHRLREWIRQEVRKALEEGSGPEGGMIVPPPPQRPAPKSDDIHRAPGQQWQDGRYHKQFAAKDKKGSIQRFKTRQGAQQHTQQ